MRITVTPDQTQSSSSNQPQVGHLEIPNQHLHCLIDSHSTVQSSQMIDSNTPKKGRHLSKFYTFSKIKEQRIWEKNQYSEIIMQRVLQRENCSVSSQRDSSEESSSMSVCRRRNRRLQTLDDAKTIRSFISSKSVTSSRCKIEESIIVMRGTDLPNSLRFSPVHDQHMREQPLSPSTPYFQKRKSLSLSSMMQINQNDCCKNERAARYGNLLHFAKSGVLCSFEKVTETIDSQQSKMISVNFIPNTLQVYAILPLSGMNCSAIGSPSVILYEPYEQTFIEYVGKLGCIQFKTLISHMIEIIRVFISLRDFEVYFRISLSQIVMSNQLLKAKIIPRIDLLSGEREMIKSCGMLLIQIFELFHIPHNGVHEPKTASSKCWIEGLDFEMQLKSLRSINQLISNPDISLHEGYLQLQTLLH